MEKHQDSDLGYAFLIIVVMLIYAHFNPEDHRPENSVLCTTVEDNGCQYLLPEGSDALTHRADCRNPLHWERVLQDTSWYHMLPNRRATADTSMEIHTPKGKNNGKEDQGL